MTKRVIPTGKEILIAVAAGAAVGVVAVPIVILLGIQSQGYGGIAAGFVIGALSAAVAVTIINRRRAKKQN